MKDFDTLNDREVVDLTEEQIAVYIKTEMMKEGLAPVGDCPAEPEKPVRPATTERVYEVGLKYGGNSYYFRQIENAETVADTLREDGVDLAYEYADDSIHYPESKEKEVQITPKDVHSKENAIEYTRLYKGWGKLHEAWEKAKAEWQEQGDGARIIRYRFQTRIDRCWNDRRDAESTWGLMQDYLEMCDGVQEKALEYLKKVKDLAQIEKAQYWYGQDLASDVPF